MTEEEFKQKITTMLSRIHSTKILKRIYDYVMHYYLKW